MKALTDTIIFESERLVETVKIFKYYGVWGYEWSNGLNSEDFKTFDAAFRDAKRSEKNQIKELKFEKQLKSNG